MASENVLPVVSPAQPSTRSLQRTTITELEMLVERTILDARPLMSVARIRILLHVWDACEACEATGSRDGGRCVSCDGKGYRVPEKEAVQP